MEKAGLNSKLSRSITIVLTAVLAMGLTVEGGVVTIGNVITDPIQPTETDEIIITARGWLGYLEVEFLYTNFSQSDTSLQLDYYFDFPGGMLPVARRWEIPESIGMLPENTYDLTVQAFVFGPFGGDPQLSDTYLTSFTVIPEPVTLVLVGLGGLVLLRKRGNRD